MNSCYAAQFVHADMSHCQAIVEGPVIHITGLPGAHLRALESRILFLTMIFDIKLWPAFLRGVAQPAMCTKGSRPSFESKDT